MKILMIGNKESGKTTYMASAFGMLNHGVDDFHINTDEATRSWYQRLFNSILEGDYPRASDKRDSHKFKLACLGKNVLDFEWIDYNGGIIKTIDANELMKDINSCDGTMLFFDADALSRNSPSVHQVRRILSLITEKLGNIKGLLFSVIIVVTKIDLLSSVEDYQRAIAPLNAFLENARGNDKIYASIIPVSCTADGLYNVELPILDMLDSGLREAYYKTALKVQEELAAAQNYQDKSGILDWIDSKLSGVPTYGELARDRMSEAQKQLELFQSIEAPMERLKSYVQSYELTWPVIKSSNPKKNKKKSKSMIRF